MSQYKAQVLALTKKKKEAQVLAKNNYYYYNYLSKQSVIFLMTCPSRTIYLFSSPNYTMPIRQVTHGRYINASLVALFEPSMCIFHYKNISNAVENLIYELRLFHNLRTRIK